MENKDSSNNFSCNLLESNQYSFCMRLVSVKDISGGHYGNRWLKMLVMSLIQLARGLELKTI